jgi:hypothetical protein
MVMMGGNYFLLPWSCGFKFNWEQQKHLILFDKCWSLLVEKVQQNSRLFLITLDKLQNGLFY